jgi:hypothetical protein
MDLSWPSASALERLDILGTRFAGSGSALLQFKRADHVLLGEQLIRIDGKNQRQNGSGSDSYARTQTRNHVSFCLPQGLSESLAQMLYDSVPLKPKRNPFGQWT